MLLERGVEIFTLAEDSGRVYVECLGDGVQVDEASCELEVGVCDLPGFLSVVTQRVMKSCHLWRQSKGTSAV